MLRVSSGECASSNQSLSTVCALLPSLALCFGVVFRFFRREQARDIASKMLHQTLVTKQTGERGRKVSKVRRVRTLRAMRSLGRRSRGEGRCAEHLESPSGSLSLPGLACCSQVFLMERLYMRRELYFSIVLDRAAGGPIIVASTCGGTSIEDVAERNPELIIKVSAVCAVCTSLLAKALVWMEGGHMGGGWGDVRWVRERSCGLTVACSHLPPSPPP